VYQDFTVNLGNLLLSISDAMDLAAPDISSHQLRTGYTAWRMAQAAGLAADEVERIFVAALMHDVGALSLEEKQRIHRFDDDLDPHCRIGADLLEGTAVLAHAAPVVRHHHRQWSEWDRPIDDRDVFASQVLLMADFVERKIDRDVYILHQVSAIQDAARAVSGTLVHADVVDLLMTVSGTEEFWFDLVSPRLYSTLLNGGPHRRITADLEQIESVATLLSHIIDYRSRFTSTHSASVAESAVQIARRFGLGELDVRLLGIAGVTHDLGKLAVPNAILDKLLHLRDPALDRGLRADRRLGRPAPREARRQRLPVPPRRRAPLDRRAHPRGRRRLHRAGRGPALPSRVRSRSRAGDPARRGAQPPT
jgi:HD-GYP domain-containing protein (c-di-GMP phosphodiesterase class II)